MNIDGSNVTRLTDTMINNHSPTWSSDSNKIAFVWENKRAGVALNSVGYWSWDICIVDSDGKNLINLTEGREEFRNTVSGSPIWSPDGKKIAFISGKCAQRMTSSGGAVFSIETYPQIYVYNVATKDMQNISNSVKDSNIWPCWSPDSSKIAFYSNREDSIAMTQYWKIFTVNVDGSNIAKLSDVSLYGWGTSSTYYFDAATIIHWAPDGNKIIFMSKQLTGGSTNANMPVKWEIMMIDPDGKNLWDTGKYVYNSALVAWSPDSKYFAYVPPSNRYNPNEVQFDNLAIMDIVTKEVKTIFDCKVQYSLTWR
jgi:TolB protein